MKQLKKTYNSNFLEALTNAVFGIRHIFRTQINIKLQTIIAIIVIILAFVLKFSKIEFLFLIFTIAFVLFAEAINTAIEATVDLYTKEYHPKAKIAKDVAAGAVIIAVLNSIITGIILFGSKILDIIMK